MAAGNNIKHGFVTERVEELKELNLILHQLRHRRTGARFLHLEADDRENLFAVGFRTTPQDSTGVAHILEHTVLCGSKRFPVRDIFFSMLNRSLNTFMNALTSSDWTFYPFATQNRKDFDNLMDVYLDSVFFPLLRPHDFHQEGIRFEFSDPQRTDSPLAAKGVVYNEMKGALANPASLLHYRLCEALYPTTTYGKNSGGEPMEILKLTWEDLRDFHATYYHPGNAWFYSYGNLPLEETLAKVEEQVLRHFEPRRVESAVPLEQRYQEPLRVVRNYPLAPGQSPGNRALIQMGWLTCPIEDSRHRLGLTLLSVLLLGDAAAPLHKALIDSHLGEGICPGSGFQDENRETYFAAGIQGTEVQHWEEVERVILDTLERSAVQGFTPSRIESAIHQLELAHREVTGDAYPYGLQLLMRLIGPWLHGDDPLTPLHFAEDIREIRRQVENGPFFENLIRRYLLENSHRVSLLLKPDEEEEQRQQEATERFLRERLQKMSPQERREIVAEAEELKSSQERFDDVSCLPTLELDDIPREEEIAPYRSEARGGARLFSFPQATNGIGYFYTYLDLMELPEELRKVAPVFSYLLTRIGAGGDDYLAMAERIAACTGGVRAGTLVLNDPCRLGPHKNFLEVKGKALIRNQGKMFSILKDILLAPDFSDHGRLATLLDQLKISLLNSISGSGHHYAAHVAAANLTSAGRQREEWGGLDFVRRVQTLADQDGTQLAAFAARMQEMAGIMADHGSCHHTLVMRREESAIMAQEMAVLTDNWPGRGGNPFASAAGFTPSPRAEGWSASLPVSYVARVWPAVSLCHDDCAGLLVLAKLLRSRFLHREIREKGGAYGGLASFDPDTGLFSMISYRDPHLVRTLQVFRQAVDWAVSGNFSDDDIKESILSVFSDIDRPLSPSSRGSYETLQFLKGVTPAMRQRLRAGIFAVNRQKLIELAEKNLLNQWARSAVGVLSGKEKLMRANEELGDERLTLHELT
ncbi:MAG: peptidase M16 [Desulfuromonadaceae bacterium]|nr:peptidase M16 [Desulfuromonadaceae bacterium]